MDARARVAIASLTLFLAVGAGAFGSHGLHDIVDPQLIEVWKTAVLYQLVHGLGLLLIAILHEVRPLPGISRAWLLMLAGMLMFSGSLYCLVLTGARWLGPVTPLGGLILMLSWLLLAWASVKQERAQPEQTK